MLQLFNKTDGHYVFPDSTEMTSEEIRNSGNYPQLFQRDCVVTISDGIFSSYEPLSQLAHRYGIDHDTDDESDPEYILTQVKDKIEESKKPVVANAQSLMLKAAAFAALSFTDEQALEVPDLYPAYEVDHAYKKDERFTYNGRLFKVNQAHTSAAQWVPGETGTESLYTCLEMAGDGYLVWTQPTGAHNAYNTGDIVHYPTEDDPLYKSLIDGNVWSPDTYPQGWEIYNEE